MLNEREKHQKNLTKAIELIRSLSTESFLDVLHILTITHNITTKQINDLLSGINVHPD